MELIKKETVYHYKLNQDEKISLIGILSMVIEGKQINLNDEESVQLVKKLRDDLAKD